ncbi:MAG TPA: type III secretion protein [Phycisphaerales bacterium]|nr:type III secretion protein [Phycisphaerales bacterium]
MLTIEPIFQYGILLMLVAFRLGGILLMSPVVASATLPAKAKVFLVVTLAVAVFPVLNQSWHVEPSISLVTIGQLMVTETLIGAAIGFIASIPIVAMQLGGTLMGMQMGLGLAQVFNPVVGGNSGVIDQLMFYVAVAIFITLGGLDTMFLAVVRTYETIPLGSMTLHASPVDLLVGLMTSAYELALRVAAPVLAIMMLETIASGVLMKTIPQINILSIGFAIKTIAGMMALVGSLVAIQVVFEDQLRETMAVLMQWVGAGAPAVGAP